MSLFNSTNAFLGLDLGTSSVKVVELVNRRQRVEVGTYASAEFSHDLIAPEDPKAAVSAAAAVVNRLLDEAEVSCDTVIAALPSSIVFTTVINLPPVDDADMESAVRFAARDVVPANLDETSLSWSRLGGDPHTAGEPISQNLAPAATNPMAKAAAKDQPTIPVFVTAAPKNVIDRYTQVIAEAHLVLVALEVETFPLARSLFSLPTDSALIVDIGDQVTNYHIIDSGTPRVSHSIDYGGNDVTEAIVQASSLNAEEAESQKFKYGLSAGAPEKIHTTISQATKLIIDKAQQLQSIYAQRYHRNINKTILIGGGANLKDIAKVWSDVVKHKVIIGNPWKGLSYPNQLESKMQSIGPNYAVAVGLAHRGIGKV